MNKVHSLRVLIAEDVEFIRELITKHLLSFGIQHSNIKKCSGGFDAIDHIQESHYTFDFIIADIMMPNGDGFVLFRYLTTQNYKTNLIILSSVNEDILNVSETISRKGALNLIGAFQKPLSKKKLKELIISSINTFALLPPEKRHSKPDLSDQYLVNFLKNEESYEIENTCFSMFYQPKVCTRTGNICGYEALVRLHHPDKGVLLPDLFLNIVRNIDKMFKMTMLTFQITLEDMKTKDVFMEPEITLSVNVDVDIFCSENFIDELTKLINTIGIAYKKIIIEVTETQKIKDYDEFLITASRLRMLGFGLSIDDFGCENSNLNRLAKTPFTELKIDQQYIVDIHKNKKNFQIVKGVVNMAKIMNIKVVAEGVETQQIAEKLLNLGVDELQGYYFSPPLSFFSLNNFKLNENCTKLFKN